MGLDDKKGVVGGIADAADAGFDAATELKAELADISEELSSLRSEFNERASEISTICPGAIVYSDDETFTYEQHEIPDTSSRIFKVLDGIADRARKLIIKQESLQDLLRNLEEYEFASRLDYLIVRAFIELSKPEGSEHDRLVSKISGDYELQYIFNAMNNPDKNIKDEDAIEQQRSFKGNRKIQAALKKYAQGVIDAYIESL